MERKDRNVSTSSLRERHKKATREELRRAALALFAVKGFSGTSVDDIAHAAGVSRSTFFRYFPSKETVLHGEVDTRANLFLTLLRARPPGETRLEALEETLIEFSQQMDSDSRRDESLLTESIVEAEPTLRARRAALVARWKTEVAQILAERGGRENPNVEDALASAILSQMTELMGAEWRSSNTPVTGLIRDYFKSLRRLVGA